MANSSDNTWSGKIEQERQLGVNESSWPAQTYLARTKHSWEHFVEMRCSCGRQLCFCFREPAEQRLQPGGCEMFVSSDVHFKQTSDSFEAPQKQAQVTAKAKEYTRQQTEPDLCASNDFDIQALPEDADILTDRIDYGKLGMLVSVVDNAAADFVYGQYGSRGRPAGMLDIHYLHNVERAGWFSKEEQVRWSKFVHMSAQAGWELQTLLQVTDQLRCLQYGSDLDPADLPRVSREQLDDCLAEYCEFQEEADILKAFLDFVHDSFSQAQAVLLPAKDIQQRLSSVQIS